MISAMTDHGRVTCREPNCIVTVNNTCIRVLVFTGASINVMSSNQRQTLVPHLQHTKVRIYAFGTAAALPVERMFKTRSILTTFYITAVDKETLLRYQSSTALGLIQMEFPTSTKSILMIMMKFAPLYTGLGCLKDKLIKLHVDDTVTLVALRHRRIPSTPAAAIRTLGNVGRSHLSRGEGGQ